MRQSIDGFFNNLGARVDLFTDRLDRLSRKLEQGLQTVSAHLDSEINKTERAILERCAQVDQDDIAAQQAAAESADKQPGPG